MKSHGRHTALVLIALALFSPCHAQEKPQEELVTLPELTAYKLPKDECLIYNIRIAKHTCDFIRSLRKVPAIRASGTPTSLVIEKYLHKKSQAAESDECYVESDHFTRE